MHAPTAAIQRPLDGLPATGPEPRPHENLLLYYALESLLLGPFFFVLLIPRYFRYRTLRYRFDAEGVTMRWGILFRREISLTYARIQDIHLSSNFVERWLGLARIQVQTASGSAGAEMTIEGLREFEEIRDFLYGRMRGARARRQRGCGAPRAGGRGAPGPFRRPRGADRHPPRGGRGAARPSRRAAGRPCRGGGGTPCLTPSAR